MNKKIKVILFFASILVYFLLVNFIAFYSFNSFSQNTLKNNKNSQGSTIDFGVGNNADVSVHRERWYGTIDGIYSGNNNLDMLTFLGFLNIPINVNGFPLFWVHIAVVLIYLLLGFFILKGGSSYY